MNRKISSMFTIVMLIIAMTTSFALAETQDTIKVSIDENYVDFNDTTGYPFVDENNRMQVPFRVALEAFGAKVSWENDSKTAVAEKNGIKIEVPMGQSYILNNGINVKSDTQALMKNNRVYLPIRIVMESFGSDVNWDSQSRTIQITNKAVEKNEEQKINEPEVTIEKTKEKIYLNVKAAHKEVQEDEVLIKGDTNLENEVRINGKKISINYDGEFKYLLKDLRPKNNKIVVSAVNKETDEKIEKEINVYYDVLEPEKNEKEEQRQEVIKDEKEEMEEDKSNEEKSEEEIKEVEEALEEECIFESEKQKEKTEYKTPTINLDQEIPKVTDQSSFVISGTCENAEYIVINSPVRLSQRITPNNNKFSCTVEIKTVCPEGFPPKEEGIGNVITVAAHNGDKVLVKDYVVYYNED